VNEILKEMLAQSRTARALISEARQVDQSHDTHARREVLLTAAGDELFKLEEGITLCMTDAEV
jgi:hypothetical protein